MSAYKSSLLAAAAAGAMIVGLGAPASAFDDVNWSWNLHIQEQINKNLNINSNFNPTGAVVLENIQAHVGNVTATSVVDGVYNNQPTNGPAGGPVEVDLGSLQFNGNWQFSGAITGDVTFDNPNIEGGSYQSGTLNTNPLSSRGVTMNFDLGTITVDVPPGEAIGPFDAVTQLPEVVSAATAVGNNSSIESNVMVEVHEGQFLFGSGDVGPLEAAVGGLALGALDIDNTNHAVGAALLLGAAFGALEPANISAVSQVSNILNASVDSAATAVGNNKSITIDARTNPDAILMGDVTQVALANVSAQSSVRNVSLNNYMNLGTLEAQLNRPIVNSVATAVGNNLSIKVSGPSVD